MQYEPCMIISDRTGSAIIVWNDNRNDLDVIYVQRISASGSIYWPITINSQLEQLSRIFTF